MTGFGRVPRKEDARFVRGRGTFVDDITRPGMLHGAVLRSPYAHARILSVDTSAAESHPKVRAVLTGADLAARDMAWMPTLSHDVAAVLATDKVRYQGQEVAFVVADDRYAARDALALVEVEYEELPAVVDARRALDADAPLVREGTNHVFDWESGDAEATEAVFAGAAAPSRRASCSTRACTRRRWRRAGSSPTLDPVSEHASPCARRPRPRTPTGSSTPRITGHP